MKRFCVGLIVASALLTAGRNADAEVIWRGDFQTGNRSQWTSTEAVSTDRLQIVTSPAPEGAQYALQVTVKQGDTVYGGDRSELDYETDRPKEGDERYYHWKTYFPADYKTADYWQLFTQWHQYNDGGSPPLAFMAEGEKIQLGDENDHNFWYAPLVRGVWHDFVFHVVWSTSSSVGGVELWYDGEHQLPLTHTATLFPGDTIYLKQGLYRKNLISWDQTLYHSGMTVATQLADVMSDATPADAGSGSTDNGSPDSGTTDNGSPDAGSSSSGSHSSDAGSTNNGTGSVPDTSGSGSDNGTSTSTPATGCHSVNGVELGALLIAGLWLVRRKQVVRS